VSEITGNGGDAVAVTADVSKEEDMVLLVKEAVSVYGRLDILINNAGILDKLTPLHDMDKKLWDFVMSTNVSGPAILCREAVKAMAEQESGSIVTVASVAGIQGGRAGAAYTASKHAIIGLTRSIAWYYEPKGIRANVVCPGNINTELVATIEPHEEGLDRYMPYISTRTRYAEPEEIANVILFYASDEASFVSGAVTPVDKSWTVY
jgi:NAD(P)-dependent dehydrogenase (short-subunit alcohol dehydrogenase family)